eukprot:gb/GEZN01011212.1/.p1 GENE.gb/GEZN01011212.1/~~gb/GEZN01011212.1/.p1  ORF type:complete len:263 (-),score=39.46 gb/GEZN01011212.1/:389-1135(-)
MFGLTRLATRGTCVMAKTTPNIGLSSLIGMRGVKTTTRITGVDVVPNAKEVLISLYETTIKAAQMYEPHGYNQAVISLAEHRMKICKEAVDVEELEKKMGFHCQAEELIEVAEDELDLLHHMNETIKPWDADPRHKEWEEMYYPEFGTRPFEDEAQYQIMEQYYKQLPLAEQRQFDAPRHMKELERRWRYAAEMDKRAWPKEDEVAGLAEGGRPDDRRLGSPFWPSPMETRVQPDDLIGPFDVPCGGR